MSTEPRPCADPVRLTDPVKTARCMAILPAGCFGSSFCGREIYLGNDGEWHHLDWSYHRSDHKAVERTDG